jgi:hypothetical protein
MVGLEPPQPLPQLIEQLAGRAGTAVAQCLVNAR